MCHLICPAGTGDGFYTACAFWHLSFLRLLQTSPAALETRCHHFSKKKSFITSLRGDCELTKGVKYKTGGSCSSQCGSLAKSLVHLSVIEQGLGKASSLMGIMFCLCNLYFKALAEVWSVPRGTGQELEWVFHECCWPREMQREKLWVRASSSSRGEPRLWATTAWE